MLKTRIIPCLARAVSTPVILQGRATLQGGSEAQGYRLRELGVQDCNGYMLVFAREV